MDSLFRTRKTSLTPDWSLASFIKKHKNSSVYYSPRGISKSFYTSESKLYFTQDELVRLRKGERLSHVSGIFDSVTSKYVRRRYYYIADNNRFDLYSQIKERYSTLDNYIRDLLASSTQGVSMVRMWNISLVGALIFGMFLMTMIYRYLGQGASAGSGEIQANLKTQTELVLGEEISKEEDKKIEEEADNLTLELLKSYDEEEAKEKEEKKKEKEEKNGHERLEKEIKEMVKGYPIEKMVPEIAKKDKAVAAFLVGIAKKESNWGKRVPVLDGEDCYNYWGYRGKRAKMGTGGHTCFDSAKDAVDTVAKRIEFLVKNEKLNSPNKMVVVWKCGYDCSWDNPKAVKKWVSDVDMYFKKLDSVGGK